MKYVGMHTQISRNNALSVLLLIAFPCIILAVVWLFMFIMEWFGASSGDGATPVDYYSLNYSFIRIIPFVLGIVTIWFTIAYFCNASMIKKAVHAKPLERKDNPRVYNIVENLCMSCGMDMPQVNIVDDPQLNAFASGINQKSYAVTLTTGIINRLNDDELAGVIGHELTHIRNRDTRLLITSIIFVGIVATVMDIVVRFMINTAFYGNRRNNKETGISMIVVLLISLVCCMIAYLFTILTRFAISRKREYMADAGGAELCGNPLALASALRKITDNPGLENIDREDVAQLFIMRGSHKKKGLGNMLNGLFSTHPDPEKRIAILEQF